MSINLYNSENNKYIIQEIIETEQENKNKQTRKKKQRKSNHANKTITYKMSSINHH